MGKPSLEEIAEEIEKFFCLEQLGLQLTWNRDKTKLALVPKGEIATNKKDFKKIWHISLFTEKITIHYESGNKPVTRYVLSLDFPEETPQEKINEVKNKLANIAALTGIEVELERIGDGILIKRFETDVCEILPAILTLICFFVKYLINNNY